MSRTGPEPPFSGAGTPTPRRVLAPGRVNLIGEHLDYNQLPVLPVALDRCVGMTFRPHPDACVSCVSADDRFDPVVFSLGETIPPGPPGDWGNYLRASGQALWRARGPLRGFDGEISSSVPIASGLSSSSALVVAAALALLEANGLEVEPTELMALLAEGERYVGTAGGGMDQAVCLGGKEGHAIHLSFDPLELDPVPFPGSWRILVASSLLPAAKSGAARTAYNTRVTESQTAFAGVVAKLGASVPDYRALMARWETGVLLDASRTTLDGTHHRRFRHVLTEADRVRAAVEAMRHAELEVFGGLMLESHGSLRDDYEVSCAELDELVDRAMESGAAGARLTGAGFGGCIVALVEQGRCAPLLEALWEQYYVPRGVTKGQRSEVLFVVRPAGGARIERLPAGWGG